MKNTMSENDVGKQICEEKIKYSLYISWEFIVHEFPCYRLQSIEKEIAHDPIPNIL